MELTPARPPIAQSQEKPIEYAAGRQLLLPAPPATRIGRAVTAVGDRWNALRNDVRLMVEDHMVATPIIGLAAGFLAGRILHAVFSHTPETPRATDQDASGVFRRPVRCDRG